MASTARQRSLAGTEAVKVKAAVHDHIQQAVADFSFRFDALATGPHECEFDPEEIDSNLNQIISPVTSESNLLSADSQPR